MMKSTLIFFSTITLLTAYSCKKDKDSGCDLPNACSLTPDAGPCDAYVVRYYYDKNEKKCKEFVWGGCSGTVPFETMEACENQCDCGK